jgi:hypothetical protein
MDATSKLSNDQQAGREFSQVPGTGSKRTASREFIEELATLDRDEQTDWLEAIEEGQPYEAAHLLIREKYHARFIDIVKRHNEAPVYRVQFPAPFPGEA